MISKETLTKQGYTYPEYRKLVSDLLAEDKSTGTTQSEALTGYSRLNERRMNRHDKTYKPSPEVIAVIKNIAKPQTWVVLTEGWCGDAAQNLPLIHRLSEVSEGKITLKLLLRDENLEVMDQYLTNGGRSIPKLIALDAETLAELWTWGPRPEPVQAMVLENKQTEALSYEKLSEQIHLWYARNKGKTLERELLQRLT